MVLHLTLAELDDGLALSLRDEDGIVLNLSQPWFVPAAINALRRDAVAVHDAARLAAWERPERKARAAPPAVYPASQLSYLANGYNEKGRAFFRKHAVGLMTRPARRTTQ